MGPDDETPSESKREKERTVWGRETTDAEIVDALFAQADDDDE